MEIQALVRRLLLSLVLFLGVLILGAFGFWMLGQLFRHPLDVVPSSTYDFTLLNSFYMSAISITTVGYGEVTNFHQYLTPTGETVATWYTSLYLIVAYLVVIYASANIVAALVEGAVGKAFYLRRIRKMLEKLEGHYIVCGAGATGHHIVEELRKVGEKVVVVDGHAGTFRQWEGSEDVIGIQGDATDDDTLIRAGLTRARGVFACLNDDKDNLYISLTARQANTSARIVGRAADLANMPKLKAAGASAVVSPNMIGGLRMASEMVRPNVVTFLDTMLRATDASIRFNDAAVKEGDDAAGQRIGDLNTQAHLGLNIVALFRKDRTIVYNPPDSARVEAGDSVIVICNAAQLERLAEHLKSGKAHFAHGGHDGGPRIMPERPTRKWFGGK